MPTVLTSVVEPERGELPLSAAQVDAAVALIRQIPRDQALGLRLIALAHACAAVHSAERARAMPVPDAGVGTDELDALLGRSQAAALARVCAGAAGGGGA